ncbi:unnamed protein product [Rangifer tarandus platyrhynchus]|uniref:Uncharacterized protein n=2 Tax=Rangifer tarandus platyrhynchus TaxID=3082113 RepID=A0AC59ZLF5_RANTA|nr:unnamed protein product [Rangifer tarandus platyrhynchus]
MSVMSACVCMYIACVCISVHKCMCISICVCVRHVHVSTPPCNCVYLCLSVRVLRCAYYLTLCDPMGCCPPGSSVHGDSPDKNTGGGCMPSSRGSSQHRDGTRFPKPRSPTLQANS